MSLLQIYQWVCQRKNFQNQLIFEEVIGKSLMSCFFWPTVYIYIIINVETSIDDHSRSRECVRTVMCWTARRWEYISIAAIAVSNLPVSPLPITRLSRQAQATADTEPHSASTPPRDEPSSLVAIDDDSSINSWYSDSTHRQTDTHTDTDTSPHSASTPPREGRILLLRWDNIFNWKTNSFANLWKISRPNYSNFRWNI